MLRACIFSQVIRDGPWTKIPVFDELGRFLGHLVHDRNNNQLDAQCGHHHQRGEGKCHIHRVLSKTPIGYLVAWLRYVMEPECASRDAHMAARFDRVDGGACGYTARCHARDLASEQALLQEFFDLEAEWGSSQEPFNLR